MHATTVYLSQLKNYIASDNSYEIIGDKFLIAII